MPSPSDPRARAAVRALVVAPLPLGRLVALVLRHCGCDSRLATTLSAERAGRHAGRPELLLVDVGVDEGSATGLVDEVIPGTAVPPQIALVRPGGRTSLEAFAAGADQVITVPFTPDELAVRTYALLRRFGRPRALEHARALDGLVLSLDERVRVRRRWVRLSPTLNSLLYLLAANEGEQLSANDIRELTWGIGARASDEAVGHWVRRLRRALGDRPPAAIESAGGQYGLRLGGGRRHMTQVHDGPS